MIFQGSAPFIASPVPRLGC